VKPSVYIETTIPSYLAAWPSRDLIVAANQQITKDWWELRRRHFNLFISEFVLEEVSAGDEEAVHGIDLLMTWNCKHIANAAIFSSIRSLCEKQGYECPEICTPQELMEDL
jgi:5,10-methenyltetrahydromethanopterin hydrogenase